MREKVEVSLAQLQGDLQGYLYDNNSGSNEIEIIESLQECNEFFNSNRELSEANINRELLVSNIAETFRKIYELPQTQNIEESLEESRWRAFIVDGVFHKYLRSRVDNRRMISQFMEVLISYVSLVASKEDEVQKLNLLAFPNYPVDETDLECLPGVRGRLEMVLQELRSGFLSSAMVALLHAHQDVVGNARKDISKILDRTIQVHAPFAIEHILGFKTNDHYAPYTATKIPSNKLYKDFILKRVDSLNKVLDKKRKEDLEDLLKRPVNVGSVEEFQGLFKKQELDVPEDQDFYNEEYTGWNEATLSRLLPVIEVVSDITLPLPQDLYSEDAPQKIADLIKSENVSEHEMGLRILRLMGAPKQVGSILMQSYKVINILGKAVVAEDEAEQVNDFAKGIGFLENLLPEVAEEEPDHVVKLRSIIAHCRKFEVDIYSTLLTDQVLPTISTLLSVNADADVIIDRIINLEDNPEARLLSKISVYFSNPRVFEVLSAINDKFDNVTVNKIAENFIYYSIIHDSPEGIEFALKCFDNNSDLRPEGKEAFVKAIHNKNLAALYQMSAFNIDLFKRFCGNGEEKIPLLQIMNLFNSQGDNIIHLLVKDGNNNALEIIDLLAEDERYLMDNTNDKGDSPLLLAIRKGNTYMFKKLLEQGANLDVLRGKERGWLDFVVKNYGSMDKSVQIIKILLEHINKNNLSNFSDQREVTQYRALLFYSVDKEDVELARLVIDSGFDLDSSYCPEKGSILHYAICKNKVKLVKLLLEANVRLHPNDDRALDALGEAWNHKSIEVIKLLLEYKKENNILNCINDDERSLYRRMFFAAAHDGHAEIVALLADTGITLNMRYSESQRTALHYAVVNGHAEVVKLLLDNENIDIWARDLEQKSAFDLCGDDEEIKRLFSLQFLSAIERNHERNVGGFVTFQIPVIKDSNGNNFLHYAVRSNNDRLVEELFMDDVSSVNEANNDGFTPIHYALVEGKIDLAKALLERGAIIDSKALELVDINNPEIRSVLEAAAFEAVKRGKLEDLKFLIEQGIDVACESYYGDTLLHCAAKLFDPQLTQEILKNISSETRDEYLNKQNQGGYTALHYAASYNRGDVAKILLVEGARIDLQNHKSKCATAYQNEFCENTRYLLLAAEVLNNVLYKFPNCDESVIRDAKQVLFDNGKNPSSPEQCYVESLVRCCREQGFDIQTNVVEQVSLNMTKKVENVTKNLEKKKRQEEAGSTDEELSSRKRDSNCPDFGGAREAKRGKVDENISAESKVSHGREALSPIKRGIDRNTPDDSRVMRRGKHNTRSRRDTNDLTASFMESYTKENAGVNNHAM